MEYPAPQSEDMQIEILLAGMAIFISLFIARRAQQGNSTEAATAYALNKAPRPARRRRGIR
jgi:hypothetical protein